MDRKRRKNGKKGANRPSGCLRRGKGHARTNQTTENDFKAKKQNQGEKKETGKK